MLNMLKCILYSKREKPEHGRLEIITVYKDYDYFYGLKISTEIIYSSFSYANFSLASLISSYNLETKPCNFSLSFADNNL